MQVLVQELFSLDIGLAARSREIEGFFGEMWKVPELAAMEFKSAEILCIERRARRGHPNGFQGTHSKRRRPEGGTAGRI